jgi:hypothetical protein
MVGTALRAAAPIPPSGIAALGSYRFMDGVGKLSRT